VPPALQVDTVSFSYRDQPVLDCVSLEVAAGEFVALAGANGSGKSTLVRIVLGLLAADHGTVSLLGEPPRRLRERWRVGYVPQRPAAVELLPATVTDVVAAGRLARRGWWRRLGAADREAIDRALDAVALRELAGRPLSELSGGQRQRAFIAKALVTEPDLLVLDEPTAGVDADSQRRFRDALVDLRGRGGAVVLVSHELGAVADDLDRVLLMRQGKIGFDGPPGDLAASGVSLGVHATDLPVWLEGLDRVEPAERAGVPDRAGVPGRADAPDGAGVPDRAERAQRAEAPDRAEAPHPSEGVDR
jgi:zinc transport system ATP-binding protein